MAANGTATDEEKKEIERLRPKTRGDCVVCPGCQAVRDGKVTSCLFHGEDKAICHSRPCVFVSCRYNLAIDVAATGTIVYSRCSPEPDEYLDDLPHSCALDVAEDHPVTLDEIGEMIDVTRERVRQIETVGLRHFNQEAKGKLT